MFFSFFDRWKQKFRDMKTIAFLCENAEKYARSHGEKEPGAEHFLLAAFDLPDETVKNLFKEDGVSEIIFKDSLKEHHRKNLEKLGIDYDVSMNEVENTPQNKSAYTSKYSSNELIKELYKRNNKRTTPLKGIHVVEAIVYLKTGIAFKLLSEMNKDWMDPNYIDKKVAELTR